MDRLEAQSSPCTCRLRQIRVLRCPSIPSSSRIQLRTARLVRFDPDALRAGRGLIPETAPVNFLDDRGHGLGGVYFALRNRDDGSFAAVTEDVRRHFPTIQSFRVKAVTSSEVILEAHLVTGERVEVRRMSEGLLYYLAFAALRYLAPVSLLLVEEPENGLHPARIADVLRVLREVSRTHHRSSSPRTARSSSTSSVPRR